jgi:hypothetical protein
MLKTLNPLQRHRETKCEAQLAFQLIGRNVVFCDDDDDDDENEDIGPLYCVPYVHFGV